MISLDLADSGAEGGFCMLARRKSTPVQKSGFVCRTADRDSGAEERFYMQPLQVASRYLPRGLDDR